MRITETDATTTVINNDLDILARTMWGEARGEGRQGMLHVGSVILNRVRDGRFRNTIRGAVTQPNQFNVWSPSNANYTPMRRVTTTDPLFRLALEAAKELLESGPINNYLYFENRHNRGRGVIIGNHMFR